MLAHGVSMGACRETPARAWAAQPRCRWRVTHRRGDGHRAAVCYTTRTRCVYWVALQGRAVRLPACYTWKPCCEELIERLNWGVKTQSTRNIQKTNKILSPYFRQLTGEPVSKFIGIFWWNYYYLCWKKTSSALNLQYFHCKLLLPQSTPSHVITLMNLAGIAMYKVFHVRANRVRPSETCVQLPFASGEGVGST